MTHEEKLLQVATSLMPEVTGQSAGHRDLIQAYGNKVKEAFDVAEMMLKEAAARAR